MRYLCLIYDEEKTLGTMPKSEMDAFMGEYFAFTDGIKKSGHYHLACRQFELSERRLCFEAQKAVPVAYKSIRLATMHRIDLLIEDSVVVEVKSVDALLPVHQAQVLTYLRLTGCPAGLLVNFNVPRLTDGVRRLLNPKREGAERTEKAGSGSV